ncbi:MAG: SRPBCC family protein [Acidimicrobiia bacterium]|nr:SRPBCC family protein [Acidimicrobiia bacterium]
MTREFNAPVSSVFRAHTDPALYARWIGPHELTTTIGEWDCRTGGEWSYSSTDADGNAYDFFGSFHEVRPNELVVQTFTYAGFPDGVSLERLTFQDLGSGRCRIVAVSLLDSFESRDMMIASGMEIGIKEGYEKLDDLLAAEDSTD